MSHTASPKVDRELRSLISAAGSTAQAIIALTPVIETMISADSPADWTPAANGSVLQVALDGDASLTVTAPTDASQPMTAGIEVTQDATGGHTLTLAGVETAGGAGVTATAAADAVDFIALQWTGARWIATVTLDLS